MQHGVEKLSISMRRFAAKWSSKTLATKQNMVRWNQQFKGNCPFCLEEDKTTTHIVQCQHVHAYDAWNKGLLQLIKKLNKLKTCWKLMIAIRSKLNAWKKGEITSAHMFPRLIQEAIFEQRSLGWDMFLEGFISNKWFEYIQIYFRRKNIRCSPQTWFHRLIKYNWEFIFHIWDQRNQQLHNTE